MKREKKERRFFSREYRNMDDQTTSKQHQIPDEISILANRKENKVK